MSATTKEIVRKHYIFELKGEIIPETGQRVYVAMLDSEGRYFPPMHGKDET